jgi:hypothetical protein
MQNIKGKRWRTRYKDLPGVREYSLIQLGRTCKSSQYKTTFTITRKYIRKSLKSIDFPRKYMKTT